MSVHIGDVTTIPMWEKATKEQAVKCLEEASEVRAAWAEWNTVNALGKDITSGGVGVQALAHEPYARQQLVDECADLITATCDLLAGLGVTDMTDAMARCEQRNRERGRL